MFKISQKLLRTYYPNHILAVELIIDDEKVYSIMDNYIHELIIFSNIFTYIDYSKEMLYEQILTFTSTLSNEYLIEGFARDFSMWTDDLFTTFNNFLGIIGLKISRNIIDDLLKAKKINNLFAIE